METSELGSTGSDDIISIIYIWEVDDSSMTMGYGETWNYMGFQALENRDFVDCGLSLNAPYDVASMCINSLNLKKTYSW